MTKMALLGSCVICLIVGAWFGAAVYAACADDSAQTMIKCLRHRATCGIDDDAIDPEEELVPA